MGEIISAFAAWLLPALGSLLGKLAGSGAHLAFRIAVALAALSTLLVPFDALFSSLLSSFAGIPASVVWFLTLLQVPRGLSIVFSAYAIRFGIRRINVL